MGAYRPDPNDPRAQIWDDGADSWDGYAQPNASDPSIVGPSWGGPDYRVYNNVKPLGTSMTLDEARAYNQKLVDESRVVPPPPTPNPNPGGGFSSDGFQFPSFHPPAWQGVTPFGAPAAFSYKDFSAPSIEDARNEPGFAFALDEGQKALQNSAAYKGTLRSGGAEKGLASWTNQFADQNYGNVFNRAAQVYGTNRSNAAENYLTNYGISRDVWDRNTNQQNLANNYNFNAAAAAFNPEFQASQLKFADLYNRDALNQNTLATIATGGYQ